MIQATFDVPFDKPLRPYPYITYVSEGRVASPFRSESVAVF